MNEDGETYDMLITAQEIRLVEAFRRLSFEVQHVVLNNMVNTSHRIFAREKDQP